MATQTPSIKKDLSARTRVARFATNYRFMAALLAMFVAFAPAIASAQDAGTAADASTDGGMAAPRPVSPIADLSRRNRDLRGQLETTGRERDQVRTERDAARTERDRAQADLNTCSAERARVTAALAACQQELCREQSRQQLQVTMTRVTAIMASLRRVNARLASIEGRLTTIEHNYASLSSQVAALETTVGQHTTQIESLQQADRDQAAQRTTDLAAQRTTDQAQDVVAAQNTAGVTDTRTQLANTNRAVRVIGRAVSTIARLIPVGSLGAGAFATAPLGSDGDSMYAARLRFEGRWLPADSFYLSLAGHVGIGRVGKLGPGAFFGGDLEAGYRSEAGLRVGGFLTVQNAQIFQSYQLSETDRVRAGSVGWGFGGGLAVTPRFGERTSLRLSAAVLNGQIGGESRNWSLLFAAEFTFDLNPSDDPSRQARDAVANLPEQLPAVPAPTPHPRGEAQQN